MPDIAELSVLLRLRNAEATQRQLSGIRGSLVGLASHIGQVAKSYGLMLASGAAIGSIAASIRIFAGFEQVMARVGAVSEATAEDMAMMEAAARSAAKVTIYTATQAAEALEFMTKAGMSAASAAAALPKVLELASVELIEVGQAADIVTGIMASMGLQVTELGHVNDVLAKASAATKTSVQGLGESFKYVGPVAHFAGLSLEETTAALALMSAANIEASMAGTGLRGAITNLLNPSKEAARIMAQLGLNADYSSGKIGSMADLVGQLERSGIDAGQAMEIFGQRAGPAMLALVSQGSDALRDLQAELGGLTGYAGGIAARQMDTFSGQMAIVRSRLQDLAITFGEELAPAILLAAQALTVVLEALRPIAWLIGSISETISGAFGTVGALNRWAAAHEPVPWLMGRSLSQMPAPAGATPAGNTAVNVYIGNDQIKGYISETIRDTTAEGGFRGVR